MAECLFHKQICVGSSPSIGTNLWYRDIAVAAYEAHNLMVGCSIQPPVTNFLSLRVARKSFLVRLITYTFNVRLIDPLPISRDSLISFERTSNILV